MKLLTFLKNWTLPVAIAVGTAAYLVFAHVPALDEAGNQLGRLFDLAFPLFIFLTLFVTFAKVDFHLMRPQRWHLWLALMQLGLITLNVLAVLASSQHAQARLTLEAALTCVIAPCASAAPVVVAKLHGNIHTMTTYTLLSSLLCSITIPIVFPMLEQVAGLTFLQAATLILSRLATVMLLPLLLGWLVRHHVPTLYRYILAHPDLGFYCWSVALAITTGITVKNIAHAAASPLLLAAIAAVSLLVCLMHFVLGRLVGRAEHEPINCGQGMFQKNTGMAIWIAYMYLNPVASIGAGCYVLWQNIINSYEIWEQRAKN